MTWHVNNTNSSSSSNSVGGTFCCTSGTIHLPSRNFVHSARKITSRQRNQQLQFAFSLPVFDMTKKRELLHRERVLVPLAFRGERCIKKKASAIRKKSSHEWFVLVFYLLQHSMVVSLIQDSHIFTNYSFVPFALPCHARPCHRK